MNRFRSMRRACGWALGVAVAAGPAHAQDGQSVEALLKTTQDLIQTLVQTGVITPEKGRELLRKAQDTADGKAAAEPAKKPAVRVPYVPQVVKDQIRAEVKEEVVAQARAERWGVPNATAEWTDRIRIEGDVRVRYQRDRFDKGNPSPVDFMLASGGLLTRAPDFAAGTATSLATANTQDGRDRLRLRARLGIDAKVAPMTSAGLRLATGSATDRVSTNQTLGQDFNKYQFLLDRAFVRLDPADWVSLSAGRIANPWFSTDLVWGENLNFEGAAVTARMPPAAWRSWQPFVTAGYFPIREASPPRGGRSLLGVQAGVQWEAGERTRVKFGVAQYAYRNIVGQTDPDYDAVNGAGRSYGQYEYGAGLRQRGNTLFLTNNPLELPSLTPDKTRWGLASRFRPLAITAAAELSHFSPVILMLSGEYVKNLAFDREEISRRIGTPFTDGRGTGFQLRSVIGSRELREARDWQLSFGYRWVGSDAVLDAFTDSDLGLGGTNLKGYTLGFGYGLDRNTSLGVRYLSARTIDSPTVQPSVKDRFGVDSLQVDLNVRF